MAAAVNPGHSWPALLATLMSGESLDSAATSWAMNEVISGNATPVQIAAFAVLLRGKGETPEELAGLVTAMRDRAVPVRVAGRAVDIVGTGGDRAQTVNISTMAAIVVAASGRRVVKHGNRAASSACGAADVLEELGVVIDLPAAGVAATVAEVGIGFCFATVFHPGMRFAGPTRKELGVPTPFNFLGPLTNPARPAAAAIGCADAAMAPVMAAVVAREADAALVFHGDDGLDELTTTTTSHAWICTSGEVSEAVIDPQAFGIAPVPPARLRGADRMHNAAVVRDLVAGGGDAGVRDAVLLNAAAGIAAYDAFPGGLQESLAVGVETAKEAIDSGAAAKLLTRWVEASRRARDELS